MQQNLKRIFALFVALATITACGGGGGSDSSGGSGNSGGSGGSGSGIPAAPVWTAGQFSAESQFKNFCAAPAQVLTHLMVVIIRIKPVPPCMKKCG